MLMRLCIVCIVPLRLLAADCSSKAVPLSVNAQGNAKLYVRHITQFLPSPAMLVGGKSSDPGIETVSCRPTLHWSLLGFEPPMATMRISQINGEITVHEISFDEKKYKYAILERLDVLGGKIIGGTPDDIYTLGSHIPSKYSYIFVPRNEMASIDKNLYHGNLVSYDSDVHTIKQTIQGVIETEQLLKNWLTMVSIPNIDIPSLRKEFSFVREMLKDQEEHGLTEALTKEDFEKAIRTGVLDKRHWFRSHQHDDDIIKLKIFPMKIDNNDYSAILIAAKNNDKNIFYNRFFIDGSEKKFDNVIIFKNAQVMNFRAIFATCLAPSELIHVTHQSSGLYELELAIMRILVTIRELAADFVCTVSYSLPEIKRDFKHRLKEQFSTLLTEKMQKIPLQHHEQLRQFFTNAFNERTDRLVEEHLTLRTFEIKEIIKPGSNEQVYTTTMTKERGIFSGESDS